MAAATVATILFLFVVDAINEPTNSGLTKNSFLARVTYNLYPMAQDKAGRKFNRIPEYTREQNGKTIHVREHVRSNRKDSTGKKSK